MKLDFDLHSRADFCFHLRRNFVFIPSVVYVLARTVYFYTIQTKFEKMNQINFGNEKIIKRYFKYSFIGQDKFKSIFTVTGMLAP